MSFFGSTRLKRFPELCPFWRKTPSGTLTRKTVFHIVSFKKTARSQRPLVDRTARKGKGSEGNKSRQDFADEEEEVSDADQKSERAHGSP